MSRRSHHRGRRGSRPGQQNGTPPAPRPTSPPQPDEASAPQISATEPAPLPAPPAITATLAPLEATEASALATPAPAPTNGHPPPTSNNGCTAPQLRRFIKSRAWVPMHELRRRFGINGSEDDVTPVAVDGTMIFVGLPSREGQLLGELLRAGDIGYELSLDPLSPIVIGVYPMRPVPRY